MEQKVPLGIGISGQGLRLEFLCTLSTDNQLISLVCEPASNVDQNFRPPSLFDQYVAAPVRVQSRRLFALYFPYRQTTPQNACSNSAITINYLPAVGVRKIPNLEAPPSYWI